MSYASSLMFARNHMASLSDHASTGSAAQAPFWQRLLLSWVSGGGSSPEDDSSLPCASQLQAYTRCMDAHQNVRPRKYETEWCAEEKNLYRACRSETA